MLLDRRLFTIGISIMESLFGGIPALPRELRLVGLGPTGAGGEAMIFLGFFSGASITPEDTVRFRDFFLWHIAVYRALLRWWLGLCGNFGTRWVWRKHTRWGK